MLLTPSWRKALLLTHLITSLGWMGAIAAYLALAAQGLAGAGDIATRAAYLGMQEVGWRAVVPLGAVALTGGILQALGTPWGLARHAWVVVKLVISAVALAVLLLHMGPTDELARAATQGPLQPADLRGLRLQLVGDSAAAIVVLLVTAALGLYKPRAGKWVKALMALSTFAVIAIVVAHLSGHSLHPH